MLKILITFISLLEKMSTFCSSLFVFLYISFATPSPYHSFQIKIGIPYHTSHVNAQNQGEGLKDGPGIQP